MPRPACRRSPVPAANHRLAIAAIGDSASGFCPQRIPHGPSGGLVRSSGECSHGFFPPRGLFRRSGQASLARLLPRDWHRPAVARRCPPSPQSLDRSTTRPTTWAGHPSLGFLRLLRPWHSNAPASGLWVHLAGQPCLSARSRSALWKPARVLLALSGLPMGATQRRLSAATERYNVLERCQTKTRPGLHITAVVLHLRSRGRAQVSAGGMERHAGAAQVFFADERNSENHMARGGIAGRK